MRSSRVTEIRSWHPLFLLGCMRLKISTAIDRLSASTSDHPPRKGHRRAQGGDSPLPADGARGGERRRRACRPRRRRHHGGDLRYELTRRRRCALRTLPSALRPAERAAGCTPFGAALPSGGENGLRSAGAGARAGAKGRSQRPEQGPEQDPEQLSGLLSERMPGQLPDAKGRNKEMEPFSLVIRS